MTVVTAKRDRIAQRISTYLDAAQTDLAEAGPWAKDLLTRLADFSQGGKMIRGGLAILGYRIAAAWSGNEVAEDEVPEAVYDLAVAMELFQAGLLIHDDIMDRDQSRRGRPSLHWQYAELARAGGLAEPGHQGASLGMCGGDVAFFLAFNSLVRSGIGEAALAYCCREIMLVGLAQMRDVWTGASAELPETNAILELYRLKTGRYSFALPLVLGAMLAGTEPAERDELGRLGETIGILFQIRDDELGLFASSADTGKPIGTDIREGKKTLVWRMLIESAAAADRIGLDELLGSPTLGEADVAFVRRLWEAGDAADRLADLKDHFQKRALTQIDAVSLEPEYRNALRALLDFVSTRTK